MRIRTQRLAAVLFVLQGVATTTAAQETRGGAAWSAAWSYDEDAAQTVLGQTHRPRTHTVALGRNFDAATSGLGRHEYRILDLPRVNGAAADTNGHVHRLTFGWQGQRSAWHLQFAAVLAVSSNALKHVGDLGVSDLQPDMAIERDVTDTLRLALRADDRLGRTLVYPGVVWRVHAGPAHVLQAGIPASAWRWRWTEKLQSVVALAPQGGVWRVRDPDLVRHSDVRVRSWHAGWSLRWQPFDALAVEARAGRRFAGRLHYLLRDGTTARVEPADCNVFGIALAASF